jgi:aryl-alcohol dehydrogenase-like predicted oxidoreductase
MGWGQVDDKESIRTLHAALDAGVNFFDTAANYGAGHSERILGRAFAGRRDRVVIATKFGHLVDEKRKVVSDDDDLIMENVRSDCEDSLRRLNTDYIDLYQLHEGDYDPEKAHALRGILEELVSEGKIRAYGWSTDKVNRAQVFAAGANCAAIQMTLNVFTDAPELLSLVENANLASINKHPLASGILTGKFHENYTFPEDDMRHGIDWQSERGQQRLQLVEALKDILTSEGRTMVQGAIGWIWARSPVTIPIPGARNVKQITENAAAMEYGPLSPTQMDEIETIVAGDAGPSDI